MASYTDLYMIGFIFLLIIFHTYYLYLRNRRLSSPNSLTTTTLIEERLDSSVLKSLPTFTYSSSIVTLHDCAICLSEYTDGHECRMLPNCNHVFHYQCIDAWFTSHSNCPLCRALVQPVSVDSHTEPGSVSGLGEPGEGSWYFPEPIGSPRRLFRVIVELPTEVSNFGRVFS
ncbi:unnamed protein product [Vicia faba]|uniref:RING-type domain-containing protein n=1 Tax=Vicia faba TaxID=3906 RepID=A0AAV1B3A0_VICFA|nr:unnamed protein product [Vicia faba]